MCNGYRHLPGCNCGYGGVGHTGRSSGGWHHASSQHLPSFYQYGKTGFRWRHYNEDWCIQISCRRCGAPVYLIHYNGGYASFDSLGKPWNKHPCYDTPRIYSHSGRLSHPISSGKQWVITDLHLQSLCNSDSALLGVVIGGEKRPQGKENSIAIRCTNKKVYTVYISQEIDIKKLIGEAVLMSKADAKILRISPELIIPFQREPTPPKEYYVAGRLYLHHIFGIGKLQSVENLGDGHRLVVEFTKVGTKNLVASIARLLLCNDTI